MDKEKIIERLKFAEECVGCLSDPQLKKSAFEIILSSNLGDNAKVPERGTTNVASVASVSDPASKGELEVFQKLANFFEISKDEAESVVEISGTEWSLNRFHFGDEKNLSKKEGKVSAILLAMEKLITGKKSMSSTALANKLQDLQLKTPHTTKNIKNNVKTPDGKAGVYPQGTGRALNYVINPVGMQLAKEWLRELI